MSGGRTEAAFQKIVERLGPLVHSSALRRTGSQTIAEEITQNVFTSLARKAERLVRHPSVMAWIFKTTRFEASKATTHADPIYEVDGIMHYCVANMPGAVARTSTIALTNATMPFLLSLADKGWKDACADDPHLLEGLNVHAGKLTYFAVGQALGIDVYQTALVLRGA